MRLAECVRTAALAVSPEALSQSILADQRVADTFLTIVDNLIDGSRVRRVLEVGTRHGVSAGLLAVALPGAFVRTYDVAPSPFREPLWRSLGVLHRVEELRRGLADQFSVGAPLAGGPYDLALIDAVHTPAAMAADLAEVRPLMSPGGWIVFDDADYTPGCVEWVESAGAMREGRFAALRIPC